MKTVKETKGKSLLATYHRIKAEINYNHANRKGWKVEVRDQIK